MEKFPKKEIAKNKSEENTGEDWLKQLLDNPPSQEAVRDYLAEEIESVGKFFKGVCDRIAENRPDHVVFLDAGARAFGIPFVKYMRIKHEQNWRAEYWDDDILRSGNFSLADDLSGQHFVFVDDVIWRGRNLKDLDNLAKEKGFTFEYVALSKHPSYESQLGYVTHLPEFTANEFRGQYMGGNIAGKQKNSLYIRDADEDKKESVREAVVSYQEAILETMLNDPRTSEESI